MEKISLMYSAKQNDELKHSILQKFEAIIDHGQFIQGPEVQKFEKTAADFTGSKYAISCANGTDALTIALIAIDLKPGEVVFTPSFTYVATVEAISVINGIPYFVDIDPLTYNISAASLESSILDALAMGYKIRAIISVDLFGNPVDYDMITSIAKKYNLILISDAAQAFGSRYKNRNIGSLTDITTTSFFPTKPLGCYGDGGMIFSNNEELAHKMKSICFHGKGEDKYHHVRIGMNSRLDSIQAMILSEKMKVFVDELQARDKLAQYYSTELSGLITAQTITPASTSAWAVYTLRHRKRDAIISMLNERSIPSNVYYRTPLHLQPAYGWCYKAAELNNSEQAAQEVFCLPMHAYITPKQAEYIVANTKEIISLLGS